MKEAVEAEDDNNDDGGDKLHGRRRENRTESLTPDHVSARLGFGSTSHRSKLTFSGEISPR
ncbi:hypothetical protein CDL15_Pgr023129 [Punica granatum]|uniref:Uncharacterized protein n=1 Tax=Punica granatum TaxID=22663 RepID=A0A218X401_PUNGR|nr:hypothetical protein CDL15_Pgr023129 [Punica granatum]